LANDIGPFSAPDWDQVSHSDQTSSEMLLTLAFTRTS
jgi:hypothetical protein